MNTRTGLAVSSGKMRLWTSVTAGVVALVASLSVNAAFVITGGSASGWPVTGNDFTSDLNSQGYNGMSTGGQLSVDMDGTVTYYYIAAESAFTNSFNSGSSSMTEANDSFNWNGWDSFTVAVSSGDVLDFSFTSTSGNALTPVDNAGGINLAGLGIMTSTMTSDLVLAYNDNIFGAGDSDFDDMMVRAEFTGTAVPVPAAAWLFGSGLLGLIGMARRHKL